MGKTTADTIKEITKKHLEQNNGLLFGQCVSAVGWIGGTVPNCKGIVEIPMTDIAGPGFAVGAALQGRRPIFVVRYQGFMWYNASSLVNYAAKSKQVWGVPCPIFIRAIGMEGNGIGHTASSSLHSIFMHSPGMLVAAPMSSKEYREVWDYFISHDDPIYVSEHRRSFAIDWEFENQKVESPDITIIAISAARLNALEAIERLKVKNIKCDFFNLLWPKPFQLTKQMIASIKKSKRCIVIDSGFEISGASRSIAYEITHQTGIITHALGLEDRVCGVAKSLENITPSAEKIEMSIFTLLKIKKNDLTVSLQSV